MNESPPGDKREPGAEILSAAKDLAPVVVKLWWARQDLNLRRSAGVSESSPGDKREPAAEILSAAKDLAGVVVGPPGFELEAISRRERVAPRRQAGALLPKS